MSDLNPKGVEFELGGIKRHFLFTFNVIDEIQEEYGTGVLDVIQKMCMTEDTIPVLKYLVKTLINDEVEREKFFNKNCDLTPVTDKEVGWLLTNENMLEASKAVMRAYGLSVPEDTDEDGGEDPNEMSESL